MPRRRGGRRLATVLFLDIVGSTSVASEMGDARWHGLLSRFGNVVRGRLKAEGGREESFTGDGFLATFAELAHAVRAAEGIVEDVRLLEIEVRAGVHTGEIETIDGHVGGVGVHAGARVLSIAGASQVLVTGTVKDLTVGAPFRFRDAGVHELREPRPAYQARREHAGRPALERRLCRRSRGRWPGCSSDRLPMT